MKRTIKRVLMGTLGGVLALAGGVAALTALRQDRAFERPVMDMHASSDPAVIERGRSLVFGAAHCASCHGAPARRHELAEGGEISLSGGMEFHLPVGTFRVPNITPDRATGIGRYTDGEVARMLRYSVRPNGEALLPFMPFANLADDDLEAIISFLRAQPTVHQEIAPHDVNPLGAVVKAFVIEPAAPALPIAERAPADASVERGRYLVHSVANCVGCHTQLDMRTGAHVGPLLGGGALHPAEGNAKKTFISPNLTPDRRWGWIASWSEDVFVARFHAGRVREDSPMPWDSFRRMSDGDLRSVYRYLATVPSAPEGPDPSRDDSVVKHDAAGRVAHR